MTKPTWAMILAAGLGTRLRPFTNHRPKPALELCGRPIIYYLLDMLVASKISDVAINIHHHADYLRQILYEYKGNINIHILYEEKILGTAGGINNAINRLNIDDSLLILQGDIVLDYNLNELLKIDNFTTLLCIQNKAIKGYIGSVGCDEHGLITNLGRYYESGAKVYNRGFFSGVHFLSKEAVSLLKKSHLTGLVDEVYPQWLLEKRSINALMVNKFYDDLGTCERLLNSNLYCLVNQDSYISPVAIISDNVKLIKPYQIHCHARIEDNSTIGPLAIIGPHCQIKSGSRVERSVIMSGTIIGENEKILNTIALIDERVAVMGGI